MKRKEAILDVYNLALGAFLFASPWLLGFAGGIVGDDVWVTGGLVSLFSLMALVAFRTWDEWANLALGAWLLVSPWLLGFPHTRAMHITTGVGLVVLYLSGLELWLIRYSAPRAPDEQAPPARGV
jgi:hypothetical protein